MRLLPFALRCSLPLSLVSLALVASGCKRETVTYSVSIDVEKLPRSGARRLLFRGQEVPLSKEEYTPKLRGTFSAPGEQWLSGDVGALQLEIETPCGPTSFPYKSIAPSPEVEAQWVLAEEKKFEPGGAPVKLDFHIDQPPQTVFVHVDRREAESAEVKLGKQPLKRGQGLPPDLPSQPRPDVAGDVYEVAAPNVCVEGPEVTVAGQKVGSVGATGLHAHVVIDVKGGHCYDRVKYHYGDRKSAGSAFMAPQHEPISGQRVFISEDGPHRQETDAVFVPCPQSVVYERITCHEVTPRPCSP